MTLLFHFLVLVPALLCAGARRPAVTGHLRPVYQAFAAVVHLSQFQHVSEENREAKELVDTHSAVVGAVLAKDVARHRLIHSSCAVNFFQDLAKLRQF